MPRGHNPILALTGVRGNWGQGKPQSNSHNWRIWNAILSVREDPPSGAVNHRLTSLSGIAAALTERGIPTARGGSSWTAVQVGRVLARLA